MGRKTLRFKFSKKVKSLRKKNGWSQGKLSQQAGISRSHLWRIEKESPDVTVVTIAKLAKGFGISISKLLKF